MKPSFTAHAATQKGNHNKVFNFVTPQKRWARRKTEVQKAPVSAPVSPQPQETKLAGYEPPAWQWGQQLSDWGYDPEEAQASGMMGDPLWYQRMEPYLQNTTDPNGILAALQARNETMGNTLENRGVSGRPEGTSGIRKTWESITGGSAAPITNAAASGKSYQDALESMADRVQRMDPSMPPEKAIQIAQSTLGSEKDYYGELGTRLINEGAGGPNLESLSPWFNVAGGIGLPMRALSLPQSLTGKALWYSVHPPRTPEEIRESEAVNAALEGAQKSRELESARQGSSPLWAPLQMLGGAEKATLGFTGTGTDEGRVQFQQGLQQILSGGTRGNEVLLQDLLRKRQQEQARRERLYGGPVGAQGDRSPRQLDAVGSRALDYETRVARQGTLDPATGLYRDPAAAAEAANKNPYYNYGTLDLGLDFIPGLGTSTALESARASRWMPGNDFLGAAGDLITGNDTSHEYLTKANPWIGKDRFSGYQQATNALQKGNFALQSQDYSKSGVRIADPGQQAAWYDPRAYFGSGRVGAVSGLDPNEFKKQFEAQHGARIRRGAMSREDLEGIRTHLPQGGEKALNWGEYERDYTKNRPTGISELETTKFGAERLPLGRWLARTEKRAANEAPPQQPEFLKEFYRQQIAFRQELARRKMMPEFSDERRLTDPEQTFGSGLYERTHRMGPGRNANNVLPALRWAMTDQDLAHFDPYVAQQRNRILQGAWRPGMALGPHARTRELGWQNPLGAIGRYFGTVPSRGQQTDELLGGLQKSPEFLKLMRRYGKGQVTSDELQSELGDVPSTTAILRESKRRGMAPQDLIRSNRDARGRVGVQRAFEGAQELNRMVDSYSGPAAATLEER